MDIHSWIALALLLASLALLAAVSAAEAGVVSVNRARVRSLISRGVPRGEALHSYMHDRHSLLGALAVARSLSIIGGVAFALFLVFAEAGRSWVALAITVAAGVIVLAVLEAIPRLLIVESPDYWSARLSSLVRALRLVFAAPAWVIELPTRLLLRLRHHPIDTGDEATESDELVRLMEIEEEEGGIEAEERRMIRGVINLEDMSVHEIMEPRIDVIAVETSDKLDDAIRIIMEKGYSRVPLYEETVDNVVGVLYAKDIMKHLASAGDRSADLRGLARPPLFVPESKRVDELLADMRANRVHMAIVVDEYGGTAGLVTIEDLLEEIVGEIEDEYDREEPTVEKVSDSEVIVDARVSIDDLNELLDLHIEGEDFDTVGGFVYHELGRIPVAGDEVQTDGLEMRVLSVLGRRIKKVRVRKESPPVRNGNGNGDHK